MSTTGMSLPDPPKRANLDSRSNAALIHDMLDHAKPASGGKWEKGWFIFWQKLVNGALFEDAVRAALDAAAPIANVAAAQERYDTIMNIVVYHPAPPNSENKASGWLGAARETLFSRKPSN